MKIMILRLGLVSISATFVYINSMTLPNTQPESPFQEQTVYHVLNCQVSKHVELLTNSLESFVG